MKLLVTGATGYIGSPLADALLRRGHHVLGLARSGRSAAKLRDRGIDPAMGDFNDLTSLGALIEAEQVDAVISTASIGASADDSAATFARDRDAVEAIQAALHGRDRALVFTSGSRSSGSSTAARQPI